MSEDPKKMKVADLKSALETRGLDTTGLKAVLQQRLQEALDREEFGDTSGAEAEPAAAPAPAPAPEPAPTSAVFFTQDGAVLRRRATATHVRGHRGQDAERRPGRRD